MNRLQRWIFRNIVPSQVRQGPHHRERIIEMYSVIVEEAREEFREDNIPTLDAFLRECHEEALRKWQLF